MSRTREQRRRDITEVLVWLASLGIVVCAVGSTIDWLDAQPPKDPPPTQVSRAYIEPEEDLLEAEKIEAALLEQGYYREDVPLDFVLQDVLYTACEANGIPREIGIALIDVESEFDPEAVSPNGCYGLCQLNPKYFPTGLSYEENIRTGIGYLAEQLERYDGEFGAALTSYNAGHDTGKRVYAAKVLAAAEYWRCDNA